MNCHVHGSCVCVYSLIIKSVISGSVLCCPSCRVTTDFCVVPIEEDSEQTGSSEPAKPPVRTDMAKRRTSDHQKMYEVDEKNIPLPGTPTEDDEQHFSLSHSGSKSPGSGQLALNIDSNHNMQAPDSPTSSESFSSRVSMKSTDELLPNEK